MPDETPRVLALLSHELRGPLGVIRGYLRLMMQTGSELSEQSKQSIAAATRASDRMADILDEANLFAHLRMGDVRLESTRVPLGTVVHAAIQAAGLPATSTVDLDAAALPNVSITADEPRLRAALSTFISAVARAQSSSVVVEISARRARLANKRAVRLRIRPRTMSGVDATETDLDMRRGGFGLAIPIAAFVIEGHGGRVGELRHGDRSAGVIVTLPTAEATEK